MALTEGATAPSFFGGLPDNPWRGAEIDKLRIGIDLGGTKTEIIVLADDGRECLRARRPTPRSGDEAADYADTLQLLVDMVADAEHELVLSESDRATVGIGTPGAVSPATGHIKNSNSLCLIGRPLREDLQQRLGRPVRLANDANCFALSEAVDGAGAGASVVFGVIIGTGVGGGVVIDGRVLEGANAIAGEWGHNPLPLPGEADLPLPRCYCGRLGCVETYLSGPGLARDHLRATTQQLDAAAIAARAAAGDAACEATLSRYEERLARALGQVINLLDPDVIVLGGGLSNLERLYRNVPRRWGAHVFSDTVVTKLRPNRHGDSGGVRGAAWLWPAARD
jgi:predicted NBD/HSP70 family sugar kinase